MRTTNIVSRNRIFSPLCLIKAVHNKRKMQLIIMCHGNKELVYKILSGLFIIMHIQVVHRNEVRRLQVPEGVNFQ